ncbi:hypothetical protein EDD86DRAFT_190822 [Gorgonomyces haynaldii]|nr:hypothetical protein EDD86DRAFT_190822 [Gorgonomyces haynaldii]
MAFHGSPFQATIVNKRIEGSGRYTFPNGNIYVGELKDGHFHGKGTIYFADGGKLEAKWTHGIASEEKLTFADGLEYKDQDWDYCTLQDRRFYQERVRGFVPGEPQLSNDEKSAAVPITTDDFGYGYYADGQLNLFDGTRVREPQLDEKVWLATQQVK